MTHIILFDNETRDQLLPLTYLRPVGDLRIGILTIQEKWKQYLGLPVSFLTQDYLTESFPLDYGSNNLVINGSVLPNPQLVRLFSQMEERDAYLLDGELIAAHLTGKQVEKLMNDEDFGELKGFELRSEDVPKINRPHDIFKLNDLVLREDFNLLTKNKVSAPLSTTNQIIGSRDDIFVEEGVDAECATFNTTNGPIYLGKNAKVMEGSLVRGPFAMCENATLKMGAKIYGATTLGPYCKAGGEVKNVVFQGYSSKGHEGYLGNSVIGEWCNIGADTNCSNLKNTYEEVRVWDYPTERFAATGLQFCGLIMGDHSKCGINTMFNTGTVVGVCSNVFGTGFPRNFIPSFTWGGAQGFSTYKSEKAFSTMEKVVARRGKTLSVQDRLVLLNVFEQTARFRRWEK